MHYRINTERLEALLIEQVNLIRRLTATSPAPQISRMWEPAIWSRAIPRTSLWKPRKLWVETPQTVMRDHRKPSCGNPATFIQEITQRILMRLLMRLKNYWRIRWRVCTSAFCPTRIFPEFEQAWQEYPKRAGGNSKSQPLKPGKPESGKVWHPKPCWWREALCRLGTCHRKYRHTIVKQAATFFGPDRHFEDFWQHQPLPEVGDSDR